MPITILEDVNRREMKDAKPKFSGGICSSKFNAVSSSLVYLAHDPLSPVGISAASGTDHVP